MQVRSRLITVRTTSRPPSRTTQATHSLRVQRLSMMRITPSQAVAHSVSSAQMQQTPLSCTLPLSV
jgi:hypothetical protein